MANLIRSADHIKELLRYEKVLHELQENVENLEQNLQTRMNEKK